MGIQRHQVVIAALLIVGGLGYLFFTGMQGNMVFYYTVGEVLEQRDTLAGRPLRIAGKVVPGTIEKSPSNYLDVRFVIHEGDERVPVEFHGTVPDTLVDDSDAVVQGRLGDDGIFRATEVQAKCPSKYENETDYAKYREAGVAIPIDDLR